jgi:hypothetical protein
LPPIKERNIGDNESRVSTSESKIRAIVEIPTADTQIKEDKAKESSFFITTVNSEGNSPSKITSNKTSSLKKYSKTSFPQESQPIIIHPTYSETKLYVSQSTTPSSSSSPLYPPLRVPLRTSNGRMMSSMRLFSLLLFIFFFFFVCFLFFYYLLEQL